MAGIDFAPSQPLTLGVEEEFFLVADDPYSAAPLRACELLDGSWDPVAVPGGWLKAELLQRTVEVTTAASAQLEQLDVDLRAVRAEVIRRANDRGLSLVALGMHPDLRVVDADVSPTPAHETIAALCRRVGTLREQVMHGIHVHVGMPGLAEALRVVDAFASVTPLLTALTAHAPVVDARRSPWRSARTALLQQSLWGGTTPQLMDVDAYVEVHRLHQLENPGEQRFLWEVAPVPALGTVEVRTCDVHGDPAVALAMAALLQALAAHVLDGGELTRPNLALERHNRWSAMEFGVEARMLAAGEDSPVEVARLVHDLLDLVRPQAEALGSTRWLEPIELLLEQPPVDAAIAAFEAEGLSGLLAQARLT